LKIAGGPGRNANALPRECPVPQIEPAVNVVGAREVAQPNPVRDSRFRSRLKYSRQL
jgi:hypothetical protein